MWCRSTHTVWLEFWRDGVMEQKFDRNQIPVAMKMAFDKFQAAGVLPNE